MRQPSSKVLRAALYGLAATLLTLGTTFLQAQTFRGGINSTVIDHTGALIANATVVALQTETGSSHTTTTSSAGEFLFQDLPLGDYCVSASFPGFSTVKTDKVVVSAGTCFTLAIKLTVSSSSTVEVNAAGGALDSTSVTQTTDISSTIVNDTPMNGRDFTQFISVAPGFGGYSAGGFGSVNGTRANQVNWQIDGVATTCGTTFPP
jgi:hypothetical protein